MENPNLVNHYNQRTYGCMQMWICTNQEGKGIKYETFKKPEEKNIFYIKAKSE